MPVLEEQLATWDELLRLFPSVLIGNLERRHEAELREKVGGVRAKLTRMLSDSEKERVRKGARSQPQRSLCSFSMVH